jgi:hypothetical protein
MRRFLRWLLNTDRDMPMAQYWVTRAARQHGDPYGHESRSR